MPAPKPLPPYILIDALQDPVHHTCGRLIAARPLVRHAKSVNVHTKEKRDASTD
jgi:hypothetical protein